MATIQEETTSGNYSCPRLNESLKTVIFDPHGDLHLIIGQVECIFENISAFKCRTVSVKRDDQGQIVYHWNPIADQTNILDEPLVRHVDASTDTSIDANSTAGINIDNSSSKESSDDNSSSKEEEDDLDEELINKVTQELEHYHKMAYRFVVCSKALARASRFFNRLLFGGFSESQKPEGGEQWTVHLPHDNPTAMWHLMAIAHGNAHWIAPKKQVDLNELYELAVLCDKYDMTRLIALFSSSWIKAVWDHHKKATGVVTFSQILWISWVLGDKEIFKQSVDMLSSLCFSDGQGRLRYEGGWTWYTRMPPYPDLFSTTLEPPGAYDLIRKRRLELLDACLSPYRGIEEQMLDGKGAFVCGSVHCNAIIRGYVLQHMVASGCWPVPKPTEFREPLYRLKARKDEICITVKWLDNKHTGCLRRCKKHLGIEVKETRKDLTLSEFHERSLEAQARVSGLADGVIHEDCPETYEPKPAYEVCW